MMKKIHLRFPVILAGPMLLTLLIAAAAVTAVGLMARPAEAFPTPAVIPYRWQLDFEPGDLRLCHDDVTGDWYWFFTYTVTNNTNRDQIWAPQFTLFGDDGRIIESGENVPARVTEDLLALLKNELLQPQNEVIGEIRQGEENAIDGLVVWQAPNLQVNRLSLFIAGLSGETARVRNPVTGDTMLLRKTLQRDYLIPGDAAARRSRPVELVEERWILR